MSKTSLQLQDFLANNTYRSEADWAMISAFCKEKASFSISANIDAENGISASDFIDWYEHGFGAGDIVLAEDKPVMLGQTRFKAVQSVAILSDDKILTSDIEMPVDGLKMASESIVLDFRDVMFRQGLQFNWKTMSVAEKYVPTVNERVIFHGRDIKGLGVVRDVDFQTGEIELYCYYIYETKACGYNMHEKDIVNLQDFWFEPMSNGDHRQSKMNGIACQRRLNKELSRYGKIWNERQHRIEPLDMKAPTGSAYWYITDKLTLAKAIEKEAQLSHNRALAGNYFKSRTKGLEVLSRWQEVVKEQLAKPETN